MKREHNVIWHNVMTFLWTWAESKWSNGAREMRDDNASRAVPAADDSDEDGCFQSIRSITTNREQSDTTVLQTEDQLKAHNDI